ncbi:MAG: hypothetical protein EA359_07835 [Balneolaceae bacterium]|nr:MAG: hypothetical protein EA359_07835 [Balneolaceae bacterium]
MKSVIRNLKRVHIFLFFAGMFMMLVACNSNNSTNAVENLTSELCPELRGPEALYWDLANGIPRGDIPGGLPTVRNVGGSFIHPASPLLSFVYPAGYQASIDPTQNTIGVNVIRNDNQSIWRQAQISLPNVQLNSAQVMDVEMRNLLSFLGRNNSTPNIVCVNQGSGPAPGGGGLLMSDFTNIFLRVDNFTATLVTRVTILQGTDVTFSTVDIGVTAAPTSQYNDEILLTFLPISWQLLFRDPDLRGKTDYGE